MKIENQAVSFSSIYTVLFLDYGFKLTPRFIPMPCPVCGPFVPNPGSKERRKSMPTCVPLVTTNVCQPPHATT